jgi:multiple sugar transport system ATP-binding protein
VEAAGGVTLPAPGNRGGRDGQPVVYGVRPEHLAIANGAGGVPAVVQVVEPTGADTFVYATMAATQVCAVFTERHAFRMGDGIKLQPQLDVVHLFDAQSGRKLD